MNKSTEDYYETSSMAQSAFLITIDHEMLGSRIEGNKVYFKFANTEQVKRDANAFFLGANVPAVSYFENIKALKGVVFNHKGS